MPLHVERIAWMPSPPLAPDDGPIDIEHLQRMTLGDAGLEHEVLTMFSSQTIRLMHDIAAPSSDRRALVHTLKGSARAIGAFRVADAAEFLEAVLQQGGDPSEAFDELSDTVAGARTAIDEILRRSC
jgi:HPt (histidine-containing phosphotransfer) domain-containing protein